MTSHQTRTPLDLALRAARPGLLAALLFSLAVNVLILALPLYTMQVYDRVLGSGHIETLILLTGVAGFALLVFGLLEAVRTSVLARISAGLGERLAGPLVTIAVAAGHGSGSQPLRDLTQIRNTLGGTSIHPLLDALWVPLFAVAIWLLHPALGLAGGAERRRAADPGPGDRMAHPQAARRGRRDHDRRAAASRRSGAQRRCRPGHGPAARPPGALRGRPWRGAAPAGRSGAARWHPSGAHPFRAPDGPGRGARARRLAGAALRAHRRRHDRLLDPAGPRPGAGRAADRRVAQPGGRTDQLPAPAGALPGPSRPSGRDAAAGAGRFGCRSRRHRYAPRTAAGPCCSRSRLPWHRASCWA